MVAFLCFWLWTVFTFGHKVVVSSVSEALGNQSKGPEFDPGMARYLVKCGEVVYMPVTSNLFIK